MLQIRGLTKNYKKFRALDSVDLDVKKGEVFGFIGPNGAGKTTTMRILCGLLNPTSGNIELNGIDIFNNIRKAKEHIGYMPDFFGVYDNLKVDEYLNFYASIYGIKGSEKENMVTELLELVNLTDKKDFFVDTLSRGMKQKLGVARCLVHNPDLLVLDEPLSGMDPRARAEMKKVITTLKDMGKTVIVSSHILSELSEICTSVGIINNGKIVLQGSVEEVKQVVHNSTIVNIEVLDEIDNAKKIIKQFHCVESIKAIGNKIEVNLNGGDKQVSEILKELVLNNVPVVTLSKKSQNLEELFLEVTKGDDQQ